MDVNEVKQFIPLKVKAEVSFQNHDYISAANLVVEFTYHLTQYYNDGDTSYDSLRAAYLGASTAALMLGQMDSDDAEHYSKEALEYAGKLYDIDNSPNNAIQIVVSTKVLLFNIDLFSYCNDSAYYDEAVDLADTLVGYLKKYFPDDASVDNVVETYKSACNLLQSRLVDVKEYEKIGTDILIDRKIATQALADPTEFRYLYDKYWKNGINLADDDLVVALHYPILDDKSIDSARECSVSEMCTNEYAENWVGLSDDFFGSYDYLCETYGIEPVKYVGLPDAALIPFISSRNLSLYKKYVLNCFLSVFSARVPVVADCSLGSILDTDNLCALAEGAVENGLDAVGSFLFNFGRCIIEIDSAASDNSLLSISARKLLIGQRLLHSGEPISKDLEEKIRKTNMGIADEISVRMSRYIDSVRAKGIPTHLSADDYDSDFIYNLLDKAENQVSLSFVS